MITIYCKINTGENFNFNWEIFGWLFGKYFGYTFIACIPTDVIHDIMQLIS